VREELAAIDRPFAFVQKVPEFGFFLDEASDCTLDQSGAGAVLDRRQMIEGIERIGIQAGGDDSGLGHVCNVYMRFRLSKGEPRRLFQIWKIYTCQLGKSRLSLSIMESEDAMMTTMEDQARIALLAKGAAEQDLARLAACPPWRHAAFAAIMATLVATPAAPLAWRFALLALIFVAIALIVQSDRRRLGVFVNGYRRGKTRLVAFPMLGAILLFYAASCWFALDRGQPTVSLGLAAASFVIGYVGSTIWQRVFVRELGA